MSASSSLLREKWAKQPTSVDKDGAVITVTVGESIPNFHQWHRRTPDSRENSHFRRAKLGIASSVIAGRSQVLPPGAIPVFGEEPGVISHRVQMKKTTDRVYLRVSGDEGRRVIALSWLLPAGAAAPEFLKVDSVMSQPLVNWNSGLGMHAFVMSKDGNGLPVYIAKNCADFHVLAITPNLEVLQYLASTNTPKDVIIDAVRNAVFRV